MIDPITLLCGIIGVATVLFCFEWIPAEVVALGVMLALVFCGILTSEQAFAGFGSDTVIMIAGLLAMGAGLAQTGVIDSFGRTILSKVGNRPHLLLPAIVILVAALSAVISNTAATAFFLPIVLGLTAAGSKASPYPASKILLPLAFASILTSSVTLVSTSTNLVVNELLIHYQQTSMGMFELAPVGIPIAVVGIAYLLLIGTRILPNQSAVTEDDQNFGLRPYLSEVVLIEGSSLVGKSLAELNLANVFGLEVVRIVRANNYLAPRANTVLQLGDSLLVEGGRESILKIKDIPGLELKADVKLRDPDVDPKDLTLAEAVILPASPLIGKSLKSVRFRERYDTQVLAVNRTNPFGTQKLSTTRLHSGDLLLLQGHTPNLQFLNDSDMLRLLNSVPKSTLHVERGPIAILIFLAALLAATFKVVSLPVATISGAFLMILTRCISPQEIYHRIEWAVLILIGAMLSIGIAIDKTGAGKALAASLIQFTGTESPYLVLSLLFWTTLLLTQMASNQAAAIIIVPIAVEMALQLNYQVRPLVMMVALSASCSYLTPLEPSCLMVYRAGNYRFRDFFIVGAPLTLLIYLMCIWMVPLVWPL
jgi:di/tricarboxylate transporter